MRNPTQKTVTSRPAPPPTPVREEIPRAKLQLQALLQRAQDTDLDALSPEKALQLGAEIAAQMRTTGPVHLQPEEIRALSELMRKLLH